MTDIKWSKDRKYWWYEAAFVGGVLSPPKEVRDIMINSSFMMPRIQLWGSKVYNPAKNHSGSPLTPTKYT